MTSIEQEIAERIAAAGMRLRFDKVAQRLVAHLQAALAPRVPDGEAILFTCTAPIRLPAKTADSMLDLARGLGVGEEVGETVHGNQVRLRRAAVPAGRPTVLGFVHNPESDSGRVLDLMASSL